MKKFVLFALGVLLIVSCGTTKQVASKATDSIDQYRYDVDYVKNSGDGMSTVKVWSYGKSAKIAEEKCRANAVHGVIFKGYTGQGAAQPALVKSATGYSDHKDFFDNFFRSGDYLRYISSVVDGSVETRKTQTGEYKVSSTMTVNVKMLRKHLEQAGVIKSLTSGF
ncbi:MAG TPA: hypothetical protein DDX40_05595 [Rikenellaceae bacterium]|nr:hypothetical protein [Rikenellaceae bacterium]